MELLIHTLAPQRENRTPLNQVIQPTISCVCDMHKETHHQLVFLLKMFNLESKQENNHKVQMEYILPNYRPVFKVSYEGKKQ